MSGLDDFQRQMEEKYAAPKQPENEASFRASMEQKYQPVSVVEDSAKSLGAGILKGTGSMLDSAQNLTPAGMIQNTANWAGWLGHKMFPDKVGEMTPEMQHYMVPDMNKAVSNATNGAPDYVPKTTPGRYSKTVGEFLPGALPFTPKGGLLTKGASLLTNAVVPAVSSEAAGDLANYTGNEKYAPAARLAGALVSPLAANAISGKIAGVISPTAGANPERLRNASVLDNFDIPVTAGQKTGSRWLMGVEGATKKGQALSEAQPAAVTKAVMKILGSNEDLATPENFKAVHDSIIGDLNSIASSVVVNPNLNKPAAKILVDGIKAYEGAKTSSTQIVPGTIMGIAKDLANASFTGSTIPGSTLKGWRTSLGRDMSSTTDPHTKGLYKAAIESIDEMVSSTLKAAGRDADWSALQDARRRYRDYLAVEPAVLKAENGVLNPAHILSGVVKQSKKALAKGERGDLGDLTMAAKNVLTKIPVTQRDTITAGRALREALGGGGLGLLGYLHSPAAAITGVAAGVAGPLVKGKMSDAYHSFLTSKIGQKYAANQFLKGREPMNFPAEAMKAGVAAANAYDLPRGGDERMGRKSGGRTMINHEAMADRLVDAAERVKKQIGEQTKPLLGLPDEAITHALEVANRSI